MTVWLFDRRAPSRYHKSELTYFGEQTAQMSHNTFGHLFRVTTFGESHGIAIGCVVDGCPPLIPLTNEDIQHDLDRRRPGQSRFTTQRQEADAVKILRSEEHTSELQSRQYLVCRLLLEKK